MPAKFWRKRQIMDKCENCEEFGPCCQKQSATPREWVGLTDDEIELLRDMIDWSVGWSYIEFARAAEAKLREKNSL
jgi:hypothetical protein